MEAFENIELPLRDICEELKSIKGVSHELVGEIHFVGAMLADIRDLLRRNQSKDNCAN